VLNADEQAFAKEVFRITGMQLTEEKTYLIEHRLQQIYQGGKYANLGEVVKSLRAGTDAELFNAVVDRILTHETSFFRDAHVFEVLTQHIIPQWMRRSGLDPLQPQDVRLKIWSCGCSTGQEPYTIVMAINERFPYLLSNLQLIATDISADTLTRARNAVYTEMEVSRGLTSDMRDRYFNKTAEGYAFKPSYKSHVTFQQLNMVGGAYPTGFDIVFCRNTLIYMEDALKRAAYQGLRNSLKADGVLILGSTESVIGYLDNYVIRRHANTVYYELNPSRITFFKLPPGERK